MQKSCRWYLSKQIKRNLIVITKIPFPMSFFGEGTEMFTFFVCMHILILKYNIKNIAMLRLKRMLQYLHMY